MLGGRAGPRAGHRHLAAHPGAGPTQRRCGRPARQVETRVADAERLGLDGAGFDAALCRLGLMFCPNPGDALASARAALKPGGRFAALVFGGPQGNPCVALMMATALRHRGLPAGAAPPPGTLLSLGAPGLMQQLLETAGFVGSRCRPCPRRFTCRAPAPTSTSFARRGRRSCSCWRRCRRRAGRGVGRHAQQLVPTSLTAWLRAERAAAVHACSSAPVPQCARSRILVCRIHALTPVRLPSPSHPPSPPDPARGLRLRGSSAAPQAASSTT